MHEKFNEPIEVEAVFLRDRVVPRSFAWQGVIYHIKNIGLKHHVLLGREKIHYFSVSDGVNFFRLRFSGDSLKWQLEEIYNES